MKKICWIFQNSESGAVPKYQTVTASLLQSHGHLEGVKGDYCVSRFTLTSASFTSHVRSIHH